MSLLVNAFVRHGETLEFVPVDHADELAGFEVCRRELWGHPAAVALGLAILPALAHSDVHCEDEEALDRLEAEVRVFLAHLAPLASATGYAEEFILRRCHNVLSAIRRARELGGGLLIG